MQKQVILQVGVLAKPSIADVAFEGPRPIVNVHVRFEVPRCGERLGAQSAFVGLLLQQRHARSTWQAGRNLLHINFSFLLPRYIVSWMWPLCYWFICCFRSMWGTCSIALSRELECLWLSNNTYGNTRMSVIKGRRCIRYKSRRFKRHKNIGRSRPFPTLSLIFP